MQRLNMDQSKYIYTYTYIHIDTHTHIYTHTCMLYAYSITSGILIARTKIVKLQDLDASYLRELSEKCTPEFFSSWYCTLLYHGYKAC